MIAATSGKAELLTAINEVVSKLLRLMEQLEENKINLVPYKDSWTAAQLFRHITKSTNGMAKVMAIDSKPVERNAAERVGDLEKIFLNFESKMQSPDFIVPEEGPYNKQESMEELKKSFDDLREKSMPANLAGLVEGLPFGPVTKLELLHFVLYHTQRHLHQMEKIFNAVKDK